MASRSEHSDRAGILWRRGSLIFADGGALGGQSEQRKLIDLSMEVYKGMMTYPNVAKPVIIEMESHSEMARSVGTDQYGVDEITNHCMIVTGDHIGTHIDSWGHVKPDAPRAEGIPIDYCYGDGVVLDLTHKRAGEEITPDDIDEAERNLEGYRSRRWTSCCSGPTPRGSAPKRATSRIIRE